MAELVFFQCDVTPRDLHSFPTRRSSDLPEQGGVHGDDAGDPVRPRESAAWDLFAPISQPVGYRGPSRSEEHTSELQSHVNLVCRLLLEKKKLCRPTSRRSRTTRLRTPPP